MHSKAGWSVREPSRLAALCGDRMRGLSHAVSRCLGSNIARG